MIESMAFRLRTRKDWAMITFQDVLTWKSGGLRAFRSVLAKDARDLEQIHDESQRLFTDKFLGACAEAEARTRRALVDDVGDVYKQLERAAHDFLAAAEAVDEVAGKAKDLKRRADADGCNISDEGRVFIPDDRVPEEKVNETLEGELIMREADAILNALGLAYKVVEDLLERAKEASKAILSHGVAKPDPSWNVEEVNDWWTSLSPEEQQQIEVMHPDWVGNLGGVPFAVRDRANRRRIDPMLSELNARIAKAQSNLAYMEEHGSSSIEGPSWDEEKQNLGSSKRSTATCCQSNVSSAERRTGRILWSAWTHSRATTCGRLSARATLTTPTTSWFTPRE